MKSPPTLTLDRLILRPLSAADRHNLFRLFSQFDVASSMGIRAMTDVSEVDEWFKNYMVQQEQEGHLEWAIVRKDTNNFVGRCGILNVNWFHKRGEISCSLVKESWGQGIAREALSGVLDYAFNAMKLHRIEAQLWPDNYRMIGVLVKLGFQREGILKGHYLYEGRFGDTAVYGLVNPRELSAGSERILKRSL